MPVSPFLHPGVFLVGATAVAAPILIHILNRRRYRMMDWAAMRFLLESIRRNRRRLRIEELILLALRCLLLLLLAMALARFVGCATMRFLPGGAESQTVVLVLDDSYSMGQRLGGGTIFSAATTDLVDQLRKLSQADKVAIVRTSDDPSGEPFFPLTHVAKVEVGSLASRINALAPSDQRARLAGVLATVADVFRDDDSTNRRLLLYSDFRLVDLTGDEAEAIRKEFADLASLDVEVVALDFGRGAENNLTIERLEMMDKFAVAKVPTRVRLVVRNNGKSMVKDVEVSLKAKVTTPSGLQEVELPAGAIKGIEPRNTGRWEFQLTCPDGGSAVVEASLPTDELAADNAAHLALDVRDAIRALVVDGQPDLADPTLSESFFFVHAVDPRGDGSYGARVEVIPADVLGGANLHDYDLVALLDVAELPVMLDANGAPTYPQLEALTEYVKGGGGLAIFTGDGVNLTFYNGPFHDNGSGLSPFRLGPRTGDPRKREQFFRLDPKSIAAEPVLRIFKEYLAAGMDPTRFIRFYAFSSTSPIAAPAASPQVKPPRVLARFADTDRSPAIVARQFGEGTVLMIYTSASMAWNDWPADENGTLVVMLNDMLSYLARPQSRTLSGRVGEPIIFELDEQFRDATAMLTTPRFPEQPVIPLVRVHEKDKAARVRDVLRYRRAVNAGTYSLQLSLPDDTSRQVLFARTVDPAEGDLAPGGRDALGAAFGSEKFLYFDRTSAQAGGDVRTEQQEEFWTLVLAAALALMAVETFLAQRFGHYH